KEKRGTTSTLKGICKFLKKVTACIAKEIQPILKRFKTVLNCFKKFRTINHTNKNKIATTGDLGAF
ncbi:hypothetical protein, partial [Glaesserella parasuis]|uniref:hypothetical protein n=1 Tax=Glaesserella parasuis TaxID=738 RepID=UPI0019D6C5E8